MDNLHLSREQIFVELARYTRLVCVSEEMELEGVVYAHEGRLYLTGNVPLHPHALVIKRIDYENLKENK